jgi:uncharacterized lipoprotein NlpE involved in copper resistance
LSKIQSVAIIDAYKYFSLSTYKLARRFAARQSARFLALACFGLLLAGCGNRAGTTRTYVEGTVVGAAAGGLVAVAVGVRAAPYIAAGAVLGVVASAFADEAQTEKAENEKALARQIRDLQDTNRDLVAINSKLDADIRETEVAIARQQEQIEITRSDVRLTSRHITRKTRSLERLKGKIARARDRGQEELQFARDRGASELAGQIEETLGRLDAVEGKIAQLESRLEDLSNGREDT